MKLSMKINYILDVAWFFKLSKECSMILVNQNVDIFKEEDIIYLVLRVTTLVLTIFS